MSLNIYSLSDQIQIDDQIVGVPDAILSMFARRLLSKADEVVIDADHLDTTLANLLASAGAAAAIAAKIGGTNQTLTALTGNINFMKEGAHTLNIVTTTTAATVGGALSIAAGAGATTGAGGAIVLRGGAGGNDAVGGAATLAGGAAGGGNRAGGVVNLTGGAGAGTGAGAAANVVGGASGTGATGKGGAVNVTGGAAASTNDDGGSVVIGGGAKSGTGVAGLTRINGVLVKNRVPGTMTDTATISAANILVGLIGATPTAAATYTTPTGAVLQAALPANLAVGDSFDFAIVNLATNDTFDITVAAGASGITLKGNVTIEAKSAVTKVSSGNFRVVTTDVTGGAGTFDIYRL